MSLVSCLEMPFCKLHYARGNKKVFVLASKCRYNFYCAGKQLKLQLVSYIHNCKVCRLFYHVNIIVIMII